MYVERELNIDKQQANYDRIVAVGNEDFLESAVPVSYWLEERYPEIEKVCPVITDQGEGMQVFYGDKKLKAGVIFADSTFFDIFSFKLLDGDRSRLLEDPYGAVVSESFAVRCSATTIRSGRACASATRRVSWLPVSWKTSTVR